MRMKSQIAETGKAEEEEERGVEEEEAEEGTEKKEIKKVKKHIWIIESLARKSYFRPKQKASFSRAVRVT